MGDAGRRICNESGVSWLALSGNARIDAPGVHVRVEGNENRFKRRRRPSNPFAPKISRVARWLLLHPDEFHVQQEMDEGVFLGVQERDGLPCAHPVQVWLDLKGHPERASETARHLEETLLAWRSGA
jgi:hypothetical protein